MSNFDAKTDDMVRARPIESDDGFLDGRLKILQPRRGYRAGLDAVMVAAAIPALPGERIVEAGSGTGVASLCLLSRISELSVYGVEINAHYADLAGQNASRNGFSDQYHGILGDISMTARQRTECGLEPGSFDHAFANPPYRDSSRFRPGQDEGRNQALLLAPDALLDWIKFLISMVHSKGTITLILPGEFLEETLSLLHGRAGACVIYPLFTKRDESAKRVIVQATRDAHAPVRLLPGLILHGVNGGYSAEADGILRGHRNLTFTDYR